MIATFVAFATCASAHPPGRTQAARLRKRGRGVLPVAEFSKKEAPAEAIFVLGYRKRDGHMSASILTGRPVRESRSDYTYIAMANDANPLGNVLGGRIMHLVDICGWLAAQRHSRRTAVTAAIDQMSFVHPVPIGQLVILRSSVNRVFRTSMEVGVKVWVEDQETGEVRHTSSAYLTFVAIGENGMPVAVAPLIAESEEEKRRYHEAGRRRAQRLAARDGLAPSTTKSAAELVP
jgi:acyl-CoA hydrolase